MNSEILSLHYKKAQVYMQNRPRRVTFSLHHRLYRSVHLAEDLKILDREKYSPAGPLESRVWGEKLDQDQLEFYMTLVEENFWPIVFSNRWCKYSSIRVTEGALLDSLLVTYYTLVTEGKLLTFTTEIFQENVSTKPRRKRKRATGKEEAIKITFTYFSQTAADLTRAVEAHQGINVTAAEIRHQNPAFVPSVISDAMQDILRCSVGSCPEWVKQSSIGPDDVDSQGQFGDLLSPGNPPNSPTPAQHQVTLKYTHSEMRRRYDAQQQLGGPEDPAKEYAHLPLVLRTWHNGLASRPVEGITVVGQRLKKPYPFLPGSNCPINPRMIILGEGRGRPPPHMPIPRSGWNRSKRTVHLPSLGSQVQDESRPAQNGSGPSPSRRNSLQVKLLESNHLHDVDICKTAVISHKVQFINVVSPLTSPEGGGTTTPTHSVFDTDKLRINSSLERVRPEVVRQPVHRTRPQLPPQTKVGDSLLSGGRPSIHEGIPHPYSPTKGQSLLSGKSYVMQKYLQESASSDELPVKLQPERGEDQSSSKQQSSKFSSDNAGMLPSTLRYFRQRVPVNFADNCLAAAGCFVVRKEYVTSSRLYKTVTSLTISKIPEGGFQRWKYEN